MRGLICAAIAALANACDAVDHFNQGTSVPELQQRYASPDFHPEDLKLWVDSINPCGALQLYQSVGFQQRCTTLTYHKLV